MRRCPRTWAWYAVDRGNSDDLLPGDPIGVIGFPGLGGSTVTFTDGVVSGFLDENDDGVYEWIKTDTEVNPGNSGGSGHRSARRLYRCAHGRLFACRRSGQD